MKTTKTAVELGLLMIEWLDKCGIFGSLQIDAQGKCEFAFQPKNYKIVTAFRRTFKIKKMNKSTFGSSSLSYKVTINCKDKGILRIHAYAINVLPPSCKIVEEEVWVERELIPEHVEEAHYEIKRKVVCRGKEI